MEKIVAYMKDQFDPKRFVVRERYKFWSSIQRKSGESIQDLAARIRRDAATCDFASITNPLDEALRTRFMCCMNNEAVLKALFKIKSDELTFTGAVEVATETEYAAKVARKSVQGTFEPAAKCVRSPGCLSAARRFHVSYDTAFLRP